jgi:magnesium-transporting ATPase (P-type)
MPVQSIASYISNLISLGIMIFISLFLFLIIFLVFKVLAGKKRKNETEAEKQQKGSYVFRIINIRKDPNLLLNLFSLFTFFVIFIFFIILALCFIVIKDLVGLKLNLFFIGIIFVFVVATIIHIVRSGIFRQD